MDKPRPMVERVLFAPLPHTPPIDKYFPRMETLKRGLATLLATLVFYTQAVCAGTTSLPLLSTTGPSGSLAKQTNLLERLMKITGVSKKDAPYVFHESEWRDRMKLTDPGQDPETIKRKNEAATTRRDIENVNAKAKGMQFPELSRPGYLTTKEILAGLQIDALEKQLTPGDLAMQTVKEVVETIKMKMKALFGAATEFNYSVRQNFDGTFSRTYLVDGRATRIYNSKTRNPHGMAVTQNITNMRYSRSHILVSMDIEHVDVKGRTSYTTRRMDYHDGAKAMVQDSQLVKEMWEDTITSQNEKKSLHRFDIAYDAHNNIKQYQEKSIDENGRSTDRKWWGGTYDESKNLLAYEELTTEKGLDTHVKWVSTGYEKNSLWKSRTPGETDSWGRSEYQLTGYVKETVGPDGLEQKDVTSNMTYNAYANLLHYERTVTNGDGQGTEIVWDGDYDQYDRAAAYRQITTDSFGHTRTVEFSEGEYTVDDDLIGYREKTIENGESKEKHFQNGLYDTKHNLMDYFQTDTDSRGRVSAKHWTASGAGLGYKDGELVGFMELTTQGLLKIKSTTTGITYDALNRQNGGRETKRVTGVETDGVYTDVTVVTDTRAGDDTLSRTRRELNKVLGYEMNIVEITGSSSVKTTLGTDNRTKDIVRQLKETTVRREMTTRGDYREEKTLAGTWDGEELESVTETYRTRVVQDGFGRAMSYEEEIVRENNPASWLKRTTDQMSYNVDGNLTASHETTTNSLGVKGEVTRTKMLYDQQGRLEEYDMESTNRAEGSMTGVTAHRNRIGYNGLGDVSRYDEKLIRLGSSAVENVQWNGSYTVLGLVGNSKQVNRRVGEETVDGVVRPLDVTETTVTSGMKYTKDGASLRSYREAMSSTGSPEAVQITTLEGGTYDAYDRLATFKQKVERVTAEAVRANGQIDQAKAVLYVVTETDRTTGTFSALGALTGYTETVSQSEGPDSPAGGSVTVRRDIDFHPLGQMRSYTGDETRFDSPDITTKIDWRGTFDLYMRSSGAVEQRQEKFSTGEIGLETRTVRENVGYDELGQMVEYEETMERSDSPSAVTRIHWENGRFDVNGNLEGYRETTQVGGRGLSVGLVNTKVLERSGTTYDTNGLLATFSETSRDSAQPSVKMTTQRQSTVYDRMGRETGFVSLRHEEGQSQETTPTGEISESNLDKWTTVVQSDRRFNPVGLVTDYREGSFDGSVLSLGGSDRVWFSLTEDQRRDVLRGTLKSDRAVTLIGRSGTLYDRKGLAVDYAETTREISTTLDHGRTTDRSQATYNSLHQLISFTDRLTDDATPGVTETFVASQGQYNGFGQMEKTHEVRTQAGALVSRSEGDRWLSYDSQGRTTRDHSILVSDHGVTVDRDYHVGAFNALGRAAAERTVTTESGVDARGAEVYRIRTESNKSEMAYERNGRLSHSVDTVVASDRPDVTVTTLWEASGFNGNNQLMGSRESKVEVNPAGTHAQMTEQTGIAYDQRGRTTNYRNTITNSSDSVTETMDWSVLGFTGAGQTTGISENRRRVSADGISHAIETTTRKENMTYDLSGNLTHYKQRATGTDNPDLVSEVTWEGGHDSLNRLISFNEETHSMDKATSGRVLNVLLNNQREGISYDSLNHVVGYGQVSTDENGNNSEILWAGGVDGRGLVSQFEERTTDPQGSLTVKGQRVVTYDAAGRLTTFNQLVVDPLGVRTATSRTATSYDVNGLVRGTVEGIEETQPNGVRKVTDSTQSPQIYDAQGHLVSRHEDAVVSTFDAKGVLVRSRSHGMDWTATGEGYNGLGQLMGSDQTTTVWSPDGAFTLVTTASVSSLRYNILGQQSSLSQTETQKGSSVEKLTLPSNWNLLEPDQKLEWLKNLTFVVEGDRKGFDDLGLSGPDVGGGVIAWSDLAEEDRSELLADGKILLNGRAFDLTQASVVSVVKTNQSYAQTEMEYNNFGILSHYVRGGDDNGVGYVSEWTGSSFDQYNRVTADAQVVAREGQAIVATERGGILYNGNSQNVGHTEEILNGATPDLLVVSQVEALYDALSRQVSTRRVSSQNSTGGPLELTSVTTLIQEGVGFDEFDRNSLYTEIQFSGETLQIGGTEYAWSELSEAQKQGLLNKTLAPTDQVIQMSTVAGILYNEINLQSGFINTGLSIGQQAVPLEATNEANAPPISGITVPAAGPAVHSVLPPMDPLSLSSLGESSSSDQATLKAFNLWLSALHSRVTGPLGNVLSTLLDWSKGISVGSRPFSESSEDRTTGQPETLTTEALGDLDLSPSVVGGAVWGDFIQSVAQSLGKVASLLSGSTSNVLNAVGHVTLGILNRAWGLSFAPVDVVPLNTVSPVVERGALSEDGLLHKTQTHSPLFIEETRLVRSHILYDTFNRISSYLDFLFNVRDMGLLVKTFVHDIDYNALGQQIKTISDIHRLGVNYDDFQTVIRDGIAYNRLGQMIANRDVTTQNGLTLTTLTNNIHYDRFGRMVESLSVIHKTGDEIRVFFQKGGADLTPLQQAALLNLNSGKSLGDLVEENIISRVARSVPVDETVISETKNIVYDSLNRVMGSEETSYYSDGSRTTTLTKEVAYDERGRRVGTITEIRQGGSMESRTFLFDGKSLDALSLKDALQAEEARTGEAAGLLFWEWFTSGRLVETSVRVNLNRVSEILRLNIRYNDNGQMIAYEDFTQDFERGIEEQRTRVELAYNLKGQILTQKTEGAVSMLDGARTVSEDTQTYRYDETTGLLLGAETLGSSTTYPVEVWTDDNQDGTVDRRVAPPPITGKNRQVYGAKNGLLDMMFQESLQESSGTEVPGRTGSFVFASTFYQTDHQGRPMAGYGVSDSVSDDGYGNLTHGKTHQLMSSVNGELKTMTTVGESFLQNMDGSDNHTVITTVNGYREEGALVFSEGAGYYDGRESGLSDEEHVWRDGWVDANSDGLIDDNEIDAERVDGIVNPGEMVWVDMNGDGTETSARVMVSARSYGDIIQSYVIIGREAKLSSSVTKGGVLQANGSSSNQTMTTYFEYDNDGRLIGSGSSGVTGGVTKGLTDTDVPPDGIVQMEPVDVATSSGTQEQFFVVINGQTKLSRSRAITDTVTVSGGTSHQDLTISNLYDQVSGALVSAQGTGLLRNTEVGFTDVATLPGDTSLEEVFVSRTEGTLDQDYEIINGQSRLLKSVSVTDALDLETGNRLNSGDHRFNHSVTTTHNRTNALGQLVGSSAVTFSNQTVHVWSQDDTNGDGLITEEDDKSKGTFLPQSTLSNAVSAFTVLFGLAQVSVSLSKSWAANRSNTVFNKIGDPVAEGYNFNVSRTLYSYDSVGLLNAATGVGMGYQTSHSWSNRDTDGNGQIDSADDKTQGHWVTQSTTSETRNVYTILMGQAQVVKSVTTSYGAMVANGVFTKVTDTGAHGYSRSVTTMDYRFNEKGQMVGAVGSTVGDQNSEVWTDTNRNEIVDPGEMVDQSTTFSVENTYRVIVGQAQVVKSVTTSYGATVVNGVFTKMTDTGAHGYSRSVTTMDYRFNEKGQLVGAVGSTVGDQNSEVWTDTNRNEIVDPGEMVDQPTTFSVENTYRVIVGQAQVVKSVTTSYGATVVNGVFTKMTDTGAHGYSRSVATVNYSFNEKGQLVGAVGSTVGDQNSEVWTDTNRNEIVDVGEMVDQPTTF
ncbi:MAG: hypothetical protein JNK54_06260, partial [Elusimicrobia bacterium]|nr:hypothetical protein [Elusimicrobiota bacterium]